MQDYMTSRLSVSTEAISQEIGGETVILDLDGESYFGLDAVGSRVWQLIGQHGEFEQVFECMLEEYEVEPTQLRHDLIELIDQLVKSGLLLAEPQ